MSKSLFIVGAAGIGAYLLFQEQINAALFGDAPPAANTPSGAGTSTNVPGVPNIPPSGQTQFPPVTLPSQTQYPTVQLPSAPVAVPPPSWAVGTFYGTAPSGAQIILSISSSGSVSVNNGGTMFSGRLSGTTLTINADSAVVTQLSNGIRTTTPNGESIDYARPTVVTPPQDPVPTNPFPSETPPVGGGGTIITTYPTTNPFPSETPPSGGGGPVIQYPSYPWPTEYPTVDPYPRADDWPIII
jgi:hypothetical protein